MAGPAMKPVRTIELTLQRRLTLAVAVLPPMCLPEPSAITCCAPLRKASAPG